MSGERGAAGLWPRPYWERGAAGLWQPPLLFGSTLVSPWESVGFLGSIGLGWVGLSGERGAAGLWPLPYWERGAAGRWQPPLLFGALWYHIGTPLAFLGSIRLEWVGSGWVEWGKMGG